MKVTCPTCGFVADSLAGISKHAKTCGKKAKSQPLLLSSPTPAMASGWVLPLRMEGGPSGRKIPSQNLYKSHDRWAYIHEAKTWKAHLHPALFDAKLVGANFYWSSWILTRVYGGREREFDYGNLVGSKVIPDALKYHGVIKDDAPKHFHMEYKQRPGVGSWELELVEIAHETPTDPD